MTADHEPLTIRIVGRDEVAYIIDALIESAERRRQRGGRLNEAIADHIEDLAITLHGGRYPIEGIEVSQP